jgi:hypothetical protein
MFCYDKHIHAIALEGRFAFPSPHDVRAMLVDLAGRAGHLVTCRLDRVAWSVSSSASLCAEPMCVMLLTLHPATRSLFVVKMIKKDIVFD